MAIDINHYRKQLDLLVSEVDSACSKLEVGQKVVQIKSLRSQVSEPNFWDDTNKAQQISQQLARLEKQTSIWLDLQTNLSGLVALSQSDDVNLTEVESLFVELQTQFNQLRSEVKFTGKYDSYNVIISIYAGAGGTDAQDWCQMLFRMYIRWAESHKVKTELLSESKGDIAGLKSVSILLSEDDFLYGRLIGEQGVHRLVRLSPFNADNLRQTSFAKVEVLPSIDAPNEIDIPDSELKIDVFRSSGSGGQSVNTTDSAVRITHKPTSIVVSIQNERSQIQNKETALKIIRSRLAKLRLGEHAGKLNTLKGPQKANEWGSQTRNYVLHPYKLIKDLKTAYSVKDGEVQKVLDGDLDNFIDAYVADI